MTCREKLKIEHPDKIDADACGGCRGCPDSFGYLSDTDLACDLHREGRSTSPEKCAACWDREIPEENDSIEGKFTIATPVINATDTAKGVLRSGPHDKPFIKDSGDRTEFPSGAVRDMREGKGRCDLVPLGVLSKYYRTQKETRNGLITFWVLNHVASFQENNDVGFLYSILDIVRDELFDNDETMFLEVAKHFEEGAKKYGEYNWQKGIPTHCYIDSAVRHYLKWLRGDKDEPHDRAFVWNILCCIWTVENKPELNDYGKDATVDTNVDRCVCCGEPIPEGLQVCPKCSLKN